MGTFTNFLFVFIHVHFFFFIVHVHWCSPPSSFTFIIFVFASLSFKKCKCSQTKCIYERSQLHRWEVLSIIKLNYLHISHFCVTSCENYIFMTIKITINILTLTVLTQSMTSYSGLVNGVNIVLHSHLVFFIRIRLIHCSHFSHSCSPCFRSKNAKIHELNVFTIHFAHLWLQAAISTNSGRNYFGWWQHFIEWTPLYATLFIWPHFDCTQLL